MERIEFILTNVRSRRLIRRRKLEELDIISANRQKMLQMLQDMKGIFVDILFSVNSTICNIFLTSVYTLNVLTLYLPLFSFTLD